MKNVFAALIFAWFPVVLSAQPVAVQTGEHDRFTRVVVKLPSNADWVFGRSTDGYLLRLSVADGYNLRRFFDLIPRTRIKAVSQDVQSGELRLSLDCACVADVFVIEQGFLVIDIANGLADPDSPFEQLLEMPLRIAPAPGTSVFEGLPVILPRVGPDRLIPQFPVQSLSVMPAPQQPLAPAVAVELDALERLVVESLGRGLSYGMLEPDLSATAASAPRPPQIIQDQPLPGILFSSGLERAALPNSDVPVVGADGMACAPDVFVALATWADERPFGEQVASLRSAMVHEFDRFDPQVIVDLARLYLHFGFGREAIQTLELDSIRSQERSYLRLLGMIIDDDPVRFPDIHRQLTCPSDIALWAFLAEGVDKVEGTGSRAAILRAFKDIPVPLQRHLGPRLAERFATIGDDDAAHQALAVTQFAAPEAIETRLAAATLAGRLGNDGSALETLKDIIQTDRRTTPEAMTRFLTEANRQNLSLTPDDMISADTLRFENARTSEAGDLAAAQVQAYLASGGFAEADRLLEDEKMALGLDRYASLKLDYGLAAVARMPDADFLVFAFGALPPSSAPHLQDLVASRLLSLGFPDHALQVLSSDGSAVPDDDRQFLQASALLSMRDPNAVMRLLRDNTSDQANDFRQAARALQGGRSPMAASISASDLGENQWRSGDWVGLAQSDDPLIRDAVAAMLDSEGNAFDSQKPLASGRALLDQAAQSRLLLHGLLERFALPDDLQF